MIGQQEIRQHEDGTPSADPTAPGVGEPVSWLPLRQRRGGAHRRPLWTCTLAALPSRTDRSPR